MKRFHLNDSIIEYYKNFTFLLKMAYYAVARGENPGVYRSWEECSKEVSGFRGALFKKFAVEKDALNYVQRFRVRIQPATTSDTPTFSSDAADNEINVSESPISSNGIRSMKRRLSTDLSESGGTQRKVRILERLQVLQGKLESAFSLFKDLANEVKSIKEEISSGSKRSRVAVINIEDDTPDSVQSSSSRITSTSNQRLEDPRSSGATTSYCDSEGYVRVRELSSGKALSNKFKVDSEGYVEVYTDGACTNNGHLRAKAGVGVWFGPGHSLNVSEPAKGRPTNNSAEIEAVTLAILHAKGADVKKLKVYTDSAFLINCTTKWMKNWKKNNWKTTTGDSVKNKEELIVLEKAKEGIEVKFEHVSAHVGIVGNEAADALARAGAERYNQPS